MGDHQTQMELLERALLIEEATYGPQHVSLAVTLKGLGVAYARLGHHHKLKILQQRTLVLAEAAHGSHHGRTVATRMAQMGFKVTSQPELAIEEAPNDEKYTALAPNLHRLGRALGSVCETSKALPALQRALAVQKAHSDDNSSVLAAVHWTSSSKVEKKERTEWLTSSSSALPVSQNGTLEDDAAGMQPSVYVRTAPVADGRPLRILLLAASPLDASPTRVLEFLDIVQKAIDDHHFDHGLFTANGTIRNPRIELRANLRCQVEDVQHEILRCKPDVVHLYGHMSDRGEGLVFLESHHEVAAAEADEQQYGILEAELLSQIIAAHNESQAIKLVLLTGCSSYAVGASLTQQPAAVAHVVYTTAPVRYDACQVYCAAWYASALAGEPVGRAAAVAKNQLLRETARHTRDLHRGLFQHEGDGGLVLLPPLPVFIRPVRDIQYINVPRRDTQFTTRPAVWNELRKALLELGRHRFVVLSGLGGAGKSQLALEYISEPPSGNDKYRFIAWFAAEQPERLVAAYLKLAEQRNMPGVSELKSKSETEVISALIGWLTQQEYCLLVYDNATNWDALLPYLPAASRSRTQHVIVTTRNQSWPTTCITVEVKEMEAQECTQLVKTIAGIAESDHTQDGDIVRLSELLGRLPLALSQAAAYIASQAVSVNAYLEAYERLLVRNETASMAAKDPQAIVTNTWDVTIDALRTEMEKGKLPPLGRIMLTVCSYLAPDSIPRALLDIWLGLAYPDLPAGVDMCSMVLGLLRSYSLIRFVDADKRYISIHRVLRAIIRHQHQTRLIGDPPREQDVLTFPGYSTGWWCIIVKATNAEFIRCCVDGVVDEERHQRQLLPHLEALTSFYRQSVKVAARCDVNAQRVCAELLDNTTKVVLYDPPDYRHAKEVAEEALSIRSHLLHDNSLSLVTTLGQLGNAYGGLGDFVKQKQLLERSLEIHQAANSPHHVNLAVTLANLGNAYGALGELGKQKEVLERAARLLEAAYGPNHVHGAINLMNLGSVYGKLGQHVEQKQLLERALVIFEAVYGPNHVRVEDTLSRLAVAYCSLGEYSKQKHLLERALDIQETAYGPDNARVAETLCNLGSAYGSLGDYEKKKQLLERALEILEAAYGPDHVRVADTLFNLGNTYGLLKEYNKQKQPFERALLIYEATYGPHHERVAGVLCNLGIAHGSLQEYERQRERHERALEICQLVYGPHHVRVAGVLCQLSNAHGSLGDQEKRKQLLKQASVAFDAASGLDLALLAVIWFNLGGTYGVLGQFEEQKEALEQAVVCQEAAYGLHDVQVAAMLTDVGTLYGELGEYQRQREMLERALLIREEAHGPHHPELATTLCHLGSVYGSLGNHATSKSLLLRALTIEQHAYGHDHMELTGTLHDLGKACGALGEVVDQEENLRRAVAILDAHGHSHCLSHRSLTIAHVKQGKLTAALRHPLAQHLHDRAYRCDACERSQTALSWRCSGCDLDFCTTCMSVRLPNTV